MKKEYLNTILTQDLWGKLPYPVILSGTTPELTEFAEEKLLSSKKEKAASIFFYGESIQNDMTRFHDIFSPSLFSSGKVTVIIRDFHKIKTALRTNVLKVLKASADDPEINLVLHQNPLKSGKSLDNFSAAGTRIECYPPSAEDILNYINHFFRNKAKKEVVYEIMDDYSDNLSILTREMEKIDALSSSLNRSVSLQEYHRIKFSGFSKNVFDIFPLLINKDFSTIMRIIDEEERNNGNKMLLGYLVNFSLNILKIKLLKADDKDSVMELEKICRSFVSNSKQTKSKWSFLKNRKTLEEEIRKLFLAIFEKIPDHRKEMFKFADPAEFAKNKNTLIETCNVSSFLSFGNIIQFLEQLYQANYDIRKDRIPLDASIRSLFINSIF